MRRPDAYDDERKRSEDEKRTNGVNRKKKKKGKMASNLTDGKGPLLP